MKTFFCISLLLAGASAFVPLSQTTRRVAAAVNAASTRATNDWSDRPIYTTVSTEPVAAKQVSWLERQGMANVMLDPNYFLTWAVALLGPLIIWYHRTYLYLVLCLRRPRVIKLAFSDVALSLLLIFTHDMFPYHLLQLRPPTELPPSLVSAVVLFIFSLPPYSGSKPVASAASLRRIPLSSTTSRDLIWTWTMVLG